MSESELETLSKLLHEYIGTEAAETQAWKAVSEAEDVRKNLTERVKDLVNQMGCMCAGEPEKAIRVMVGDELFTIMLDSSYPSNPGRIIRCKVNLKLP